MPQMKCPKCRKGRLVRTIIEKLDTKLGGIPFTVRDAEVWQCAECGHVVATAKDLKKWREAQKTFLQEHGFVPSPEAVRKVRESLGLTVAELAALMAVTRQTVHAWERSGLNALQPGPAALILRLLAKEVSDENVRPLLKALAQESRARGQATPTLSQLAGDRCDLDRRGTHSATARAMPSAEISFKGRHTGIGGGRSGSPLHFPAGFANDPGQIATELLIRKRGSVWGNLMETGEAA